MPSNLSKEQQEQRKSAPAKIPPLMEMPESVVAAIAKLSPQAGKDLAAWGKELKRAWNLRKDG